MRKEKTQPVAQREPGLHQPLRHTRRRTGRSGSSAHRSSRKTFLPRPKRQPGIQGRGTAPGPALSGHQLQDRRRYRRTSHYRSADCRILHRHILPALLQEVPEPGPEQEPARGPKAGRPGRRRCRRILYRDPYGHHRPNRSEQSGGMPPGGGPGQVPVPREQPLPAGLREHRLSLLHNSHKRSHPAHEGCRRTGRAASRRA